MTEVTLSGVPIELGHLQSPPRTSSTFHQRLFSRVVVTASCWFWTGTLDANGYGILGRGVRGAGNIAAHRAVWESLVGPIPDDLVFDHLCRVPACVSPEHGELVTLEENKLRGFGAAVLHSLNPNCLRGHPKDGITRRKNEKPHRYCKTCAREKSRGQARSTRLVTR